MITQKERLVLAELMKYGYDRNIIALTDLRGNPALEALFEEMTRRCLNAMWSWYATEGKNFKEDTKRTTEMRFCFTLGIGAVWFWENREEEVETKGLYACMSEPRSEYEMDEYIEDVTGIWWSPKSVEHHKYHTFLYGCLPIIKQHYDLSEKDQELSAGELLMLLGMYAGYSRYYRGLAIEPYQGKVAYHFEVWEELYGKSKNMEELFYWAAYAVKNGISGLGEEVIKPDPNTEFGKTRTYYRQFTYKETAGVRTLVFVEDEELKILSFTPVFDTLRNYHLILDKVLVWGSGAEATIKAHFFDDEDCHITFYDTNYLENKDRYFIGQGYMFDLYGIAYRTQLVPEEERSITLEGDAAINFKKHLGEEVEYDVSGNPLPVTIHSNDMHAFFQTNDDLPEDATFRSPIKRVYEDVDFLGKKVYEVEINMPFHNIEEQEKKHPLSVYIAADTEDKLDERPSEGDPIQGVLYLQGKMRSMVDWQDCPSKVLHTFAANQKDGTDSLFTHVCSEEDKGRLMNEEEQSDFAKEVLFNLLNHRTYIEKVGSSDDNMPDFTASRNRDIWVKADVSYSAKEDFVAEEKYKYLARHFRRNRFPVIAYINLNDVEGNPCEWLCDGTYTAKISYGSVLPGQKIEINPDYSYRELIKELFQAYKNDDFSTLKRFLHPDLDFRSVNLCDPTITRDEYLIRTARVLENKKRTGEHQFQTWLIQGDNDDSYIELEYSEEDVDIVTMEATDGLITSIRIENKK